MNFTLFNVYKNKKIKEEEEEEEEEFTLFK